MRDRLCYSTFIFIVVFSHAEFYESFVTLYRRVRLLRKLCPRYCNRINPKSRLSVFCHTHYLAERFVEYITCASSENRDAAATATIEMAFGIWTTRIDTRRRVPTLCINNSLNCSSGCWKSHMESRRLCCCHERFHCKRKQPACCVAFRTRALTLQKTTFGVRATHLVELNLYRVMTLRLQASRQLPRLYLRY